MRIITGLAIFAVFGATLSAQQLKFNLDHLAAKAANTVDLSLNGDTLQFAARFLDGKDPDEAKVKKLISGLVGIYVRAFEFKSEGAWTAADLEGVRSQLRPPDWSRVAGAKSSDGETAEVYIRTEKGKMTGFAVIAAEPKELTVVNVVGAVDLDSLAELGGHLGVPKLKLPPVK